MVNDWLVVWNIFFHSVGNVTISTDELIFFRGVGIPPTSNHQWGNLKEHGWI